MSIICAFCLSAFRWLPLKLLPSTKKIISRYLFFLILYFHRTLSFKGLRNSLFLHQPRQSTNLLIYTVILTKPLLAFLLCILYGSNSFWTKERTPFSNLTANFTQQIKNCHASCSYQFFSMALETYKSTLIY